MGDFSKLLAAIPPVVRHPFNHTEELRIPNPELSLRLLDSFLSLPTNLDIKRQVAACLQTNFESSHGAVETHNANLRSLVLCVEPLLKALALLVHRNRIGAQADIPRLTLGRLMQSEFGVPKVTWDEQYSGRRHDPQYWKDQSCVTAVYYAVYQIRNTCSHETPRFTMAEVTERFGMVVFLLLYMVQHGVARAAIELEVSPFADYLQRMAGEATSEAAGYLDLATELVWVPEGAAENVRGPVPLANADEWNLPPIAPFLSVVDQVQRFVVTGASGAGKTRSLRTAVRTLAKRILALDVSAELVPVYLPAYMFGLGRDPSDVVSNLVGMTGRGNVAERIRQGPFWFFIDGLNEVAAQNRTRALQEVRALLLYFPSSRVVVSTREASYRNELQLPVYRLADLTLHDTQALVDWYAPDKRSAEDLYEIIRNDARLMAFLRTPLQTKLLCSLVSKESLPGTVPSLMRATVKMTVDRERQGGIAIHEGVVDNILGAVASKAMQRSGYVLSVGECLEIAAEAVAKWRLDVSPSSVLDWLIDAGLLRYLQDEQIAFFHEMALDYFAARSIVGDNDQARRAVRALQANPELRSRPALLEMATALLPDSSNMLADLLPFDPVLAATCYRASQDRPQIALDRIFEEAGKLTSAGSQNTLFVGIQLLMLVDEKSATDAAFEAMPNVEWGRMSEYSTLLCRLLPKGTEEQIERCLNSSDERRLCVLLDYSRRFRKAEYVDVIISMARKRNRALSARIAAALGSIGDVPATEYLAAQLSQPHENREIPLEEAIAQCSTRESEPLMRAALTDADVRVRRAAVATIYKVCPSLDQNEAARLVREEEDLFIRLTAAQILLRSAPESEREAILKGLFRPPCLTHEVPAERVINLVGSLTRSELKVIVLEALCTESPALQGLVTSKAVSRFPDIADDLTGIVDFDSREITVSAKCAILEGLIQTDSVSAELAGKVMGHGMPRTLKESLLKLSFRGHSMLAEQVAGAALADEDPQVRLSLASALRESDWPGSQTCLLQLVHDNAAVVATFAFRSAMKRGWATDAILLDIARSSGPPEVRRRAVAALCNRRFIWNPEHVCRLCVDADKSVRSLGRRIIRVIADSEGVLFGRIKVWNAEGRYGFVEEIVTRRSYFAHVSDVEDSVRDLECGGFCSFIPQSWQRGLRATKVRILAS
jgi:cold shock CspA family protein